jgi:phosphoribosylglycinamide formyltransferase-1
MSKHKIRLGVIGSRGGSALISANDCLIKAGKHVEWVIVTDRQCGIETWAKENRHEAHRISYTNPEKFSHQACSIFEAAKCDDVLLLYTRRVAVPLIDKKHIWNIHQSILPSFGGLNGLRDAFLAGVRLFGATLHRVNADLDTGKIFAQVCAPLPIDLTKSAADYLSYLQKVWLILVWIDQLTGPLELPRSDSILPAIAVACPGISDNHLRNSYVTWVENIKDLKERLG